MSFEEHTTLRRMVLSGRKGVRGPIFCSVQQVCDNIEKVLQKTREVSHEIAQIAFMLAKRRSDDVIISAGWTISPAEIESTLLKHKDIEEAVVIGVPDKDRGNVVKASTKVRIQRPSLEQEIRDYVKENLSKHGYPRIIEFADEPPKTSRGNVKKQELLERSLRQMGIQA
jgi:acyl-CoA synthetase (AMP-forming)/AMP-acid ligase II